MKKYTCALAKCSTNKMTSISFKFETKRIKCDMQTDSSTITTTMECVCVCLCTFTFDFNENIYRMKKIYLFCLLFRFDSLFTSPETDFFFSFLAFSRCQLCPMAIFLSFSSSRSSNKDKTFLIYRNKLMDCVHFALATFEMDVKKPRDLNRWNCVFT